MKKHISLLGQLTIQQPESVILRAARHGKNSAMENKPRRIPADYKQSPLAALAWTRGWDEGHRLLERTRPWIKSDTCQA